VTRTYKIALVAIVAAAAVGGYWKFALAPKRAEVAALDQQVATAQAQLAQTQNLIVTYKGARDAYASNYATVVRLGKAVPADDDTRSLLVQLNAAADRSGVDFDTINVNGGGASSGGATAVTPGAINVGAFSAMPFNLSFSGDFGTLGNFFSRLERFVSLNGDQIAVSGRLLRVESIALQPGEDGWPALNAQIGASAYIVPDTKAVGDPATAAAPTSTTTDAAAPATGNDAR
jgi:Tfp pilus assembly protein PilO